jgi:predicted DNA-binding WGR domain protein
MTSLCIRLEARSPAHRCHRAYEIALTTDLFGAWLVEMRYGRIGARGRTKARSFSSADEAAAQVKACLRRRASAPRWLGVAYRPRSAIKTTNGAGLMWRNSSVRGSPGRRMCLRGII